MAELWPDKKAPQDHLSGLILPSCTITHFLDLSDSQPRELSCEVPRLATPCVVYTQAFSERKKFF